MGSVTSRKEVSDSTSETYTEFDDGFHPWSISYTSTLPSWKYSAVLWGFEPRIDYISNVKARLQPWCTGGRYFSVTKESPQCPTERPHCLLKVVEGCFKQETFLKLNVSYNQSLSAEAEPAGHYLKLAQVVGYRDGIAIIQLNMSKPSMEFLVIHMKTNMVTGIHSMPVTSKHYLCDAIISPDLSSFILKPNAMYVLNFCRGDYNNIMKLISCKGAKCPLVKSMFSGMAVRPFVSFDPRYRNMRLAVANYLSQSRDIIAIYDLEKEEVIARSDISHYQTTHNIVFSPDGNYIASLILGRSVKDGMFNFPRVLIYSGDDLKILHVIRTSLLAEVPTLSPAALFPLFSETGTHIAVAYGEQGTFYQQVAGVNVYKVPIQLDLQSLCRLTLRKYFDSQDVERLFLPSKLKSYLRFQPSYG